MMKILSFGAGVQSTALLLMSCKGILPKLSCAIFADVGWEPKKVYDHLGWCEAEAARFGIDVHIVKKEGGGIQNDILANIPNPDGGRVASLPLFTASVEGKNDGMIMRQCTSEYKITPIDKFIKRNILNLKPRQRSPKEPVIEQWMGISYDEATRAKPSRERWKKHAFPFLDWDCDYFGGKVWRRYQIINWLEENYPDIDVPRSACIGCPYHSNEEWRKIKENPNEWEEACRFDELIRVDKREGRMQHKQYLHRQCIPLRDVDIRSDEDRGQGMLWDNECEGMCGL